MNKIAIKSILLLLLFCSFTMDQISEPGKIRYSMGYGAGLLQIKEENLIPKVHRGVVNFFDFRIEKKNDLYRLFQLQLGYGKLKTAIENEAVSLSGYYFWIMKDLKAYDTTGHGGQEIIVVPYKSLVIVVTAWPYMTDTEWLRDNFCGTLLKDIIGACYKDYRK